jgi:VIT1/CCC1 family predicted Fe2+/Mn2+ transporter
MTNNITTDKDRELIHKITESLIDSSEKQHLRINNLSENLVDAHKDNKEIYEKYERVMAENAALREERGASREQKKTFTRYRQQLSHWLWYRDSAYWVLFVAGLIPLLLQTFLSSTGINTLQISLAIVSLVLFIFSWRGSRNVQTTYEE